MTPKFAAHATAMETAGWTVLRNTWSDKLLQRLATMDRLVPNFKLVREAYDGLPMRVAEEITGELVFSKASVGVAAGWFRTRVDTIASGAPVGFVPGVCIAGPTTDAGAQLSVIPGSARLGVAVTVPQQLAIGVTLAQGDAAILDSRAMRRWSPAESVFQLSVVRPWIEPEHDAAGLVAADTPPRAARFAGVAGRPAESLESWLFERHERRSS